jgi:hypothetical protein
MSDNTKIIYGGINFFEALALIFITLKLIGQLDWNWWQVLAPLWLPALGVIVLVLMGLMFGFSGFVLKGLFGKKAKTA